MKHNIFNALCRSHFSLVSKGCCYSSKHGRRSKFKWPDTFLIESSGRRETPESIAESKAREAKRQNATQIKQPPSSTPEEDDDIPDTDADVEAEHRFTESDIGSDQDISDDEEVEDSIMDETSELITIIIFIIITIIRFESSFRYRQFIFLAIFSRYRLYKYFYTQGMFKTNRYNRDFRNYYVQMINQY